MIRAHREPQALTLAVAGPATMTESPAVQASASEEVSRGMRALRVDLRDCTTMDSTFSGTLLALKRQLDAVGGSLTLVSPSPKVCEQLDQMGLDDFYAVDIAAPAEGAWREVPCAPGAIDALRRLVIDAHEQLARVPGPAARTFRGVADELRRPEPEPRCSEPELPSSRDA
jgi:anti-anti-sigma factor